MKFNEAVNWLLKEAYYNKSGVRLVNIDGELLYKLVYKSPQTTIYYKDPEARIPHRLNGPAVVRKNGEPEWWIEGEYITPEEVEKHKKKLAISKEIQSHENNRIDPRMLEDYL